MLALVLLACTAPPQRHEFSEPHMGTAFRLVLYAPSAVAARSAAQAAFARVAELDGVLSDYDPTSEVRRLQAQAERAPTPPLPVSDDLFAALRAAQDVAARTGGAFDVTVGPFVRLWRRTGRQGLLPSAERLAEARAAVSWQYLVLEEPRSARLLRPGMRLDFGGIGVGIALDAALDVLAREGIGCALVDGGGDIAVRGTPPGQEGWHVGVDAPFGPDQDGTELRILLQRGALVTSGDLYQFVEIDGVRYSHVIDPDTGLGLARRTHIALVADTGTRADAWSTALCVLGPDRGLPLVADDPALEARFSVLEAGAVRTYESAGFSRLLVR